MIKCVIFDMDGTLVDSEGFWKEAEKKSFYEVGIELTDEQLNLTMGMRYDEVVKYWLKKYDKEYENNKTIELAILARVQELIEEKGKALPGAFEILEFFKQEKIPIALASSSPLGIIQSVIETLKIKQKFKVTYSAEYEEYGKPHPAVFIATANYMRVEPEECLVFEDSMVGVLAAKSAKMKCVAIPPKENYIDPRFSIADLKINSLLDFNKKMLSNLID